MALILEVLDGKHGGVQSLVRLDALPLTLGRGYENDLVLDDPYVDGTHARIVADDAGTTMIEDLGSVNGLGTPGRPGRHARLALTAGIDIRIGRTTLRVRDTADPVPAARPDPTAHALPAASRWGWIDSAGGRLAVSAAAILAIAVHAWLGSYSRTGASDATGAAMAYVLLAAIWAGIWAIAGRVVVHRFNFLAHFAVASVVALVTLAVVILGEWTEFLFPDNPIAGPLASGVLLFLVAALVARHLALASAMPRPRRWRAGLITVAVLVAVGGFSALTDREAFSDVPSFSAELKPFPAGQVPTSKVQTLGNDAAKLKRKVDRLAEE